MENSAEIFKALTDISRLRILKALQSKPLCACEIKSLLGLASSTVSQHLKILKNSGFIIEEKDGRWVNFRINLRPGDPRISAILSALDFWIGDEAMVIQDKERLKTLDRSIVCNM